MIGHFNTGELASYHAGIVSDGKAARIAAHLSGCAQCADVHSGIADVSRLLGSAPVPAMPETLTRRLHAAIANEARQRALGAPVPSNVDGRAARDPSPVLTPGRPDLPERARRRAPRRSGVWTSPLLLRGLAAAGVLVLLAGGGILLANQRGLKPASPGIGAPAARTPTRNRPASGAVGATSGTTLRYRHAGGFAYANVVTSALDYTKADLPGSVRREVASSSAFGYPSPLQTSGTKSTSRPAVDHATVGRLESCLSTVAGGGIVMLVEVAHYLGQPATIIIFQPVDNAFEVIVAGQACGPAGQDIITRLLVPTR